MSPRRASTVSSTEMAANNGNSTDTDHGNQDAKWYPQIPLPSELINSYQTRPQLLHPEAATAASPSSLDHQSSSYTEGYSPHFARDANFAAAANDLINQSLGRTPGGTSVVEPDSVLGESGRLYHGYKEGKYFIPNDAVSLFESCLDFAFPCQFPCAHRNCAIRPSKTGLTCNMKSTGSCSTAGWRWVC